MVIRRIKTAWFLSEFGPSYTCGLRFINNLLFGMMGRGRFYRFYRYLEGARRTKEVSGLNETDGYYADEGVEITFYGACPVQGDGEVDGMPCYYRSRGEGWQFHVASSPDGDPLDDDAWFYEEAPYFWPAGGWVHRDTSIECIKKAVAEYRNQKDTDGGS